MEKKEITNHLNQLFTSNAMQEFTFNYVAQNKSMLENMKYSDFYNNFNVTKDMFASLVKFGESNGVENNWSELENHKDLFALHMKAQIARQIWNNNGFYPIFNQTNEVLQQAVKMFDKADNLDRTRY